MNERGRLRRMGGEWSGRRVLVVGLGASGFAAARALASLEAKVKVTEGATSKVIEERAERLRLDGIEVTTAGHADDVVEADIAVVSPGIPPHASVMTHLVSAGVEVVSEIELAFRLARCDFLAVTGTNGKTTTTSLLASMLSESGLRSVAAGNIGLPLIDAVFEVPDDGIIAVEVSSFQLVGIREFRPRVAVLLNIAEDHTDWHGSFDNYIASKARIATNQTSDDVFVVNRDDEAAVSVSHDVASRVVPFSESSAPADGIGWEGDVLVWREQKVLTANRMPLAGAAGREDVAAAAGAALEYGADVDAVRHAVESFQPLRHRLEVVARAGGVTYINDSKATNPHATIAATKGLRDVVLIAGGRAKGIDLSVLRATVPPVIEVVALGEASDEIARTFEGLVDVTAVGSMHEAVGVASAKAIPGGSVLLSPACASLDMYESYVQRGEAFSRAVSEVVEHEKGSEKHGDE